MRDKIVHWLVNFVFLFATKEYYRNIEATVFIGTTVLKDPELSQAVLDKLEASVLD